jgi:hypothetical protein
MVRQNGYLKRISMLIWIIFIGYLVTEPPIRSTPGVWAAPSQDSNGSNCRTVPLGQNCSAELYAATARPQVLIALAPNVSYLC